MKKLEKNQQFSNEKLKQLEITKANDRFYQQCADYLKIADPKFWCYSDLQGFNKRAIEAGHKTTDEINNYILKNGFMATGDDYEEREEKIDNLKRYVAATYMVCMKEGIKLDEEKDLLTVITEDLQYGFGQEMTREIIGGIENGVINNDFILQEE